MRFETTVGKHSTSCRVDHDDGRWMASCYITAERTLYNVMVCQDFRGQGVGKFMMREVMKLPQHPTNLTCAPFGAGCLTVDQTQSFYEKFGFVPVGQSSYGVPMQLAELGS